MNSEDQFEKRLARQPLRPVPPAWREEILSAARQVSRSPQASRITHDVAPWSTVLAAARSQLSNLLWPHPRAWAGLAAAWLLVIGLTFAAREPAGPAMARQPVPPSPQMRELLRQQEQLLADLIGPAEPAVAVRSRPLVPAPHSQLRGLTPAPGSAGIPAGEFWRGLASGQSQVEQVHLAAGNAGPQREWQPCPGANLCCVS